MGIKQLFRFLRGELDGTFVSSVTNIANKIALDNLLPTFVYLQGVQFKTVEEISENEIVMKDDDIKGIAKIIGVFQPKVSQLTNLGSIRFTEKNTTGDEKTISYVDGTYYTERGLFNMTNERFEFIRKTDTENTDDIVTQATSNLRMSLVPHGYHADEIKYIYEGETVLTDDGEIIEDMLHDEPPTDSSISYSEYYGDTFLYLAETTLKYANIDISLFKKLVELNQWIRYNNISIQSITHLVEILFPLDDNGVRYLSIDSLVWNTNHLVLTYTLNNESILDSKDVRKAVFDSVLASKFVQVVTVEN